jgi:CRP/FNR family cyclic AMP-dependent transcriptional regulator
MKTDTSNDSSIEQLQTNLRRLKAAMAGHPFLDGLRPGHVEILAQYAMESGFAVDQMIFREGEMANRFYLILHGRVALETTTSAGKPLLIGSIGAGEVLGWSWLFPPYCWHFSARALEPTKAIFFYGTWLREQCEQDRDLGYELVERMAEVVIQRLQATRRQLAASVTNQAKTTKL